jgi:hypothetical protein
LHSGFHLSKQGQFSAAIKQTISLLYTHLNNAVSVWKSPDARSTLKNLDTEGALLLVLDRSRAV